MTTCVTSEALSFIDYFDLHQNPFPVSPDSLNFFIADNINIIVTEIIHGILARKGFFVLTGDVGLGKTTISRRVIRILEKKMIKTSLVLHTSNQGLELIKEINRDFGISVNQNSIGENLHTLNNFLLAQNRKGKNCAIIIDDAQNLSTESFELVRMISNLETDRLKLVQILLTGQSELMEKLNSYELRQLKSRIMINWHVEPLSLFETMQYIQFKLNSVGGKGNIRVDKGALKIIYKFSQGNHRLINTIMDRSLYVAFLYNTKSLTKEILKKAALDIKPDYRKNTKTTNMLSVICIMSIVFSVFFLYHEIILFSQTNQIVNTVQNKTVKKQIPEIKSQITSTKKNTGSEHLVKFLESYNLEQSSEFFINSVKNNDFKATRKYIYQETGMLLINLDTRYNFQSHKYGTLCIETVKHNKTFLLFWKPEIIIDNFYNSYTSNQIKEIQIRLSEINIFNSEINGIVNIDLFNAIANFQKISGCTQTGYPDSKTLFLLCNWQTDIQIKTGERNG